MATIPKTDAALSYQVRDTPRRYHQLWVMELAQEHSLTVRSHQSRLNKQHYPKAYAPGDLNITGKCESQEDYQELAYFIRKHQQELINAPGNYYQVNKSGFDLLLQIDIQSEQVSLRGFVDAFGLSKRGYFDPAPEYKIAFTPIYDNNALINYDISGQIGKFAYPKSVKSIDPETTVDDVIPPSLEPENRDAWWRD